MGGSSGGNSSGSTESPDTDDDDDSDEELGRIQIKHWNDRYYVLLQHSTREFERQANPFIQSASSYFDVVPTQAHGELKQRRCTVSLTAVRNVYHVIPTPQIR